MLNKFFCITLLLMLSFLVGCAQTSAYRTVYSPVCNYQQVGDCEQQALQQYALGEEQEYHLSFVEFDDQGQLNDRQQMQTVIDHYRAIAGTEDVLLVLFVHGWHHNAKVGDNNIDSFRELLKKLAKAEIQNSSPRKVLGLYLGWRGSVITHTFLQYATFWDRKNTANSVGQQGVTELLLKLEEIVNVKKGSDNPQNNKLISIGHSFGGAVLYTSLQQILVDRFIDSRKGKIVRSIFVKGFGDLVVLMNPAFEALRYATLYDISQEYCRRYDQKQLPKLAILTSETDYATGIAFPLGRFFSTFLESHATLSRHQCKAAGGTNKVPVKISESEADRKSVGHFIPFLTHRLNPLENTVKRSDKFQFEQLQKSWSILETNQSFDFESTQLIPFENTTVVHNPYLNIQVDTQLISNHNDIWGDEVISFIRDLIIISME